MIVSTATISGRALDWASIYPHCLSVNGHKPVQARDLAHIAFKNGAASHSTDWAAGGSVIESLFRGEKPFDTTLCDPAPFLAAMDVYTRYVLGDLDADTGTLKEAVRRYVELICGKEIDIPDEFL